MKKFKVGEKVKIRKWYDMVNEFGIDEDGSIKTKNGFVEDMRELCGKTGIIVDGSASAYRVAFDDKISLWSFDPEMFEPNYADDVVDYAHGTVKNDGDNFIIEINLPDDYSNKVSSLNVSIYMKE